MGSVTPATWDLTGEVSGNAAVSAGLYRLDLELPRPVGFLPGQFAMLNLTGAGQLVFRRPFSILAADGRRLSFLYRVVGRGTARLEALRPGERVDCLAPLGRAFPAPGAATPPALILAGGVGLPPLHAWVQAHGRPDDLACFGTRDGADVPWGLLDARWHVSVDRHEGVPRERVAHAGLVTELALGLLGDRPGPRLVLACGPTPLLRAAAGLAQGRGWPCFVSLEEHMGCGYGVCKGCVVPVLADADPGWRNATSCVEGPVFDAATLDWPRYGGHDTEVRP
ncbi:MAG: dihydroorotate dehydrogenase electron transfer subunit [Candidatus Krumholzibacteriia bacterium]